MKVLKYKTSDGKYENLYDTYKEPVDPFNGYDYIDMGEAGIWATCNVGAKSPNESGIYFAWGETESKEMYTQDNYKWKDNDKYHGDNIHLELEDDAAHINMGGDWRMPTKEEFEKLIDLCNVISNSNYIQFLLKSDSSKQLIFPMAGKYQDELLDVGIVVNNWSSSADYSPYNLYFQEGHTMVINYNSEYDGLPVRGFIPKSE